MTEPRHIATYGALVLAIVGLVWQAGSTWGGSRSEAIEVVKAINSRIDELGRQIGQQGEVFNSRLDAQSDRITANASRIQAIERLASDNAQALGTLIERFAGYIETRKIIVEESARDRAQLNTRVSGLENDRIASARLEQRLKTIEELLLDRLPPDLGYGHPR